MTLNPATRKFFGPCNNPLQIVGESKVLVVAKGRKTMALLYVVKNLKTALIGKPEIEVLELITQRISLVETDESAKLFRASTANRVPLALEDKVKAELDILEKQGIIRPITKPTEW